jgi:hypothetical protein
MENHRRCAPTVLLAILGTGLTLPCAVAAAPKMKVVCHAVVNDTIVGAQAPCGLVRDPSDGSLVLAFQDKGDIVAGTVTYFVRSVVEIK